MATTIDVRRQRWVETGAVHRSIRTKLMSVFCQVLDRSSGNVIKDYPSEEAALAELRGVGQDHGFEEMRSFALLKFQDGHPTLVAMEDDLIALLCSDAVAALPGHAPLPRR